MPPLETYSIATKMVFWLLWLICAAFLLLVTYMLLGFIRELNGWPKLIVMILWFTLVVLVQGTMLFKLTSQFLHRAVATSLLINRLVFIAFGLPFFAACGCNLLAMLWY